MNKSKFLKHVNELTEEQLREELLTLFQKVDGVKEFYLMDLGSEKDRQKIFAKFKIEIQKKFATKSKRRPRRPRIQKAHLLLKELKKVSIFGFEMIDPYLFTAETAITFSEDYYFTSTPLLNIIKSSFEKACLLITEEKLQKDYQERCSLIRKKCARYYTINEEIDDLYHDTFS